MIGAPEGHDWNKRVRRIVTGHNEAARSVFIADGPTPESYPALANPAMHRDADKAKDEVYWAAIGSPIACVGFTKETSLRRVGSLVAPHRRPMIACQIRLMPAVRPYEAAADRHRKSARCAQVAGS